MLRILTVMFGYVVKAVDGKIGYVHEFLFEDDTWEIKYMVVSTGGWPDMRKVLISPAAIGRPEWSTKSIHLTLTTEQVENSPDIDTDKPVSRQQLDILHQYYGWPFLLGGGGIAPLPLVPLPVTSVAVEQEDSPGNEKRDPHLHSSRDVLGYHIQAIDHQIGHLEDFIVDDERWEIRYLVIDTKNWLPGRHVLIAPGWIKSISWEERKVHVDLRKEAVEHSPGYNPELPVNREYEVRLYDYYGRPFDR